ncbi:MAG: hypothetical protein J7M26_06505 [Armatimonadetes bacterium]|nr:hypothetical protein [Armatimonadota bacterium]
MPEVELLVSLKIPDVTALTAANTLRRRMGYGEVLEKLDRADYYLFDIEAADVDAACERVRDIAEHTTLFVNPNKHVFEVQPWQAGASLRREGDLYVVHCLVRSLDYDAGPGMVESLHKLGYGEVRGLQTGTLWTLHLRVREEAAARALAEEIAVTKSRSQGLLANPHYQTCEVL